MTAFTKEIEDKIRDLGLALKLQMDFAAAADMTRQDDRLQLVQNNAKAAALMIGLIRELKLSATDDVGCLNDIVKAAEHNGSHAADVLKAQVPKISAINTEVKNLIIAQKKVSPEDMNRIFRKHLAP
jgi:hypothetical protein